MRCSHLARLALLALQSCSAAAWLTQISGKSVATRDGGGGGEGQKSVNEAHELQSELYSLT